nr:MAG TPA: hypothetical protein [Caudoviricetes sp.]
MFKLQLSYGSKNPSTIPNFGIVEGFFYLKLTTILTIIIGSNLKGEK